VSGVGQVLSTILWIYLLILLARLVFDYVMLFARSWEPRGVLLLLVEAVFTVTDPPLRLLRRFIPPLRIGGVSLDLSFLVLFILIQILIQVVQLL
jgi:YggT family protein